MKLRNKYTCPLELTHDIIRGKWKPIILWQLGKGASSLVYLQESIEGIGQKMLLQHLRELQDFDMIQKKQFNGYPLKVEYSLTERGKQMLDVVITMQKIGIELMKEDGKEDFLKEKGLL
ncbi:transcriptional regulator [Clostridium carboxidivorans P7]|uniref:Transcriptional regulator, HxlR family n=1 Tax=Clostridium carboxidivorans P7 TaxID=536227 RepID=C6PNT5_9CLOT|nr:helix-turn-helix domain-containing protein [Clostridium carboxidivorans]AKN31307.1 transcriptional regulator [Clostridium carboxidivorans P7]EET89013.1 transcriptional regulator, HxlR family [Clostridium carboxidivorans P7]EFG88433.1 HxlR-like helix-turn-helix domain-containing protein [Clostridium carboxidivorans P7]